MASSFGAVPATFQLTLGFDPVVEILAVLASAADVAKVGGLGDLVERGFRERAG
jgi:hypothetical protein